MSEDNFLKFCDKWGKYDHKKLGITPEQIKRKTITEFCVMMIPVGMMIAFATAMISSI